MISFKSDFTRGFLSIMLAGLFPLFFTLLWLFSNTQLPTSDATDYLVTAHTIYHHFTDNGLLHFDIARGWRPIFFSVFTVPFLFLSTGKLSFAWQAVAVSCVIASVVYVYLLSRVLLNRLPAIITANLIVILPFVQIPVLTFFAESALFPLVMGAVYHLVRSDYFRQKSHTWGFVICMTLAVVTRPVEAVTELMFVLALFLFNGWRMKIFSSRQVMQVILAGMLTLFIFLLAVAMHFIHHSPFQPIDGGVYDVKLAKSIYVSTVAVFVLIAGCVMCVGWVERSSAQPNNQSLGYVEKHSTQPTPTPVFSSIFILSLLWFLPCAFKTYVWIYRTSVGDLADIAANTIGKLSFYTFFHDYLWQESMVMLIGAASLAILSALTMGKKKLKQIFLSIPVMYLLLLIPFPLWEVMFTIQTSPRKLNIAFPALMLVLLIIALQHSKGWRLRIFAASALLVMQFASATGLIHSTWFGAYPAPVSIKPNPYDEVVRFLTRESKQYSFKTIAIMNNLETALPVDPYALHMMYQIYSLPYKIDVPSYSAYSASSMESLYQNHDAIFLADKKNDMVISAAAAKSYEEKFENERNPTLKVLYKYLFFYSANKLHALGWQAGSCMLVKARDGNIYQGCLLHKEA